MIIQFTVENFLSFKEPATLVFGCFRAERKTDPVR